MERDTQTPASGATNWQDVAQSRFGSDDFGGVIARDAEKRLIWFHSKGRSPRYAAQRRAGRYWVVYAASLSASHMVGVLGGLDADKSSQKLAKAAGALAESAADYSGRRPVPFHEVVPGGSARSRSALRRRKRAIQRQKRLLVGVIPPKGV